LFAQGFGDPRGCEYREVVLFGEQDRYRNPARPPTVTHAWVLPADEPEGPRFAVAWNGLIYPLCALGAAADLDAEVQTLASAARQAREARLKEPLEVQSSPLWEYGLWKPFHVVTASHQGLMPVKVCLLLGLGRFDLAERLWMESMWDHKGAIPTLKSRVGRSIAVDRVQHPKTRNPRLAGSIGRLTLLRLKAGDSAALDAYAAWMRDLKPDDFHSFPFQAFEPLWRYPDNPRVAEIITALFDTPGSPWLPLYRQADFPRGSQDSRFDMVTSPLLSFALFRKRVLESLADDHLFQAPDPKAGQLVPPQRGGSTAEEPWTTIKPAHDPAHHESSAARTLGPTESAQVLKVDLGDLFPISNPGTYRVEMRMEALRGEDGKPGMLAGTFTLAP